MQPPEELPEEELVRARGLVRALDDGASKFGLYPESAEIGITAAGATAIIMNFRIGALAFDDRVQAPEAEPDKDAMRALENEIVREAGIEAFLETRRQLMGDDDEE